MTVSYSTGEPPEKTGATISRYSLLTGAFRYPDFRFLWSSLVFNSLAMWMEMVAMAWLVLELTDSALMVGLVSAARLAPFFFVGIPIGAVADRVQRHIFLRFINGSTAFLGVMTAALVLSDLVQVWHLMALSFLSGGFRAANLTTRSSYVYDLVGPQAALNGLALTSLSQRLGGVLGGLGAGLLIDQKGVGAAFVAMAVGYIVATAILFLVREVGKAAPRRRESVLENLRGAVHAIRSNRTLALLMLLTASTEIMGFSHQTLLPVFARDVLGIGASGFGVLMAVRAAGGILGTFFIATLGDSSRKGVLLLAAISLFGMGLVGFSYSEIVILALFLLAFTNFAAGMTGVLQQALMQRSVPNEERGRAMGAMTLSIGMAPIGHVELGALGSALGAPLALLINGAALTAIGVASVVKAPRLRRLS